VAQGGYLATITSAEENAFVYGLASANPSFWRLMLWGGDYALGPWLGGVQPPGSTEPAGGWQWVTGEAWSYTDWQPATGEPNNQGDEDRLHLYRINGVIGWNDVSGSYSAAPPAYILEVGPVPEPSSLFLVLVGALLFGARLSRRRA